MEAVSLVFVFGGWRGGGGLSACDRVGRLFVASQTTEFKSKMVVTQSNRARLPKHACFVGYHR